MYLIDTSVWIPALRRDGPAEIQKRIVQWISDNVAIITGVVKIELLSGCKTKGEADLLLDRLKGIMSVGLSENDYDEAAQFAFQLRKAGSTTPVPDLLIAFAAAKSSSTLVHADSDFKRIAPVLNVETIDLLDEVNQWRARRKSSPRSAH